MTELVYGKNAILECLKAGRRRFFQLYVMAKIQQSAAVNEIFALARKHSIPVERMGRKQMDAKVSNHQGLMMEVSPYPMVDLDDIIVNAENSGEDPFLIALDHIEDPNNLGAILRTAEQVGVHGVILPKDGQASISPSVVKASAGASEYMQIAKVPNLSQALMTLKKRELWAIGVQHTRDSKAFHDADLKGPIVLVIGSEGDGMSRIVRETCDFLIEIPMRGRVESLNASVASALVLYETWRSRKFA